MFLNVLKMFLKNIFKVTHFIYKKVLVSLKSVVDLVPLLIW